MWNKREEESGRPATAPPASSQAASQAAPAPGGGVARRELPAAIGASISIVGDVTGDEDLTILGKIKGKVDLPRHNVTVGESGRVDADVHAKVVSVAGEVHGNLFAGEQILIRKTATMLGNLTAPRVGLEDGCCFRGSVDMEAPDKGRAGATPGPRAPGAAVPIPAKPAEGGAAAAGSQGGVNPAKPDASLVRP
jgi:cytoskeletal protein CcmA (bactofilin family)